MRGWKGLESTPGTDKLQTGLRLYFKKQAASHSRSCQKPDDILSIFTYVYHADK